MHTLRSPLSLLTVLAVLAMQAQPINDEPCTAIALTVNDTCAAQTATNVNATTSSGIPAPDCGNYQGNDVWFSFMAPVGIADITMTMASFEDGAMAIYTADSCDGDLLLIACDDDAGPGLLPRISRDDLEPGQTYWIRAFGYGGDTGTFSLCVAGPTGFPEGDCVYRLELFDAFGDGWQGASLAISINGNAPVIFTCEASHASFLIGLDTGDVLTITYAGGTNDNENSYWLRFGTNGPAIFDPGYPPSEGLAFTLENACVLQNAAPADCAYRLPVCADTTFTGGSGSTGVLADLTGLNQGCLAAGERAGVWIDLLVAESGALGFTVTPSIPADFDVALWGPFEEVTCPVPDQPVRCSFSAQSGPTGLLASAMDNSEGAGGDSFVDTLHVIAGQRYVLFIDNYSSNGTAFDLTFQLTEGAALACTSLPEAEFSVSDNTVLVSEPVSFTDQSSGAPYAWLWEFPGADPELSMAQDPQGITYSLPGCYDVSLTTTNIAGSDAVTHVCEVDVSISSSVFVGQMPATTASLANEMLMIDRPGRSGSFDALLLDASGRVVSRFSAQGARVVRSVPPLAAGCYSLVLSEGSEVDRIRLLVLR